VKLGTTRPSPALLVAAIALVFAMTGGAIAAQQSAKPVTKSSAKKIAKKQAAKQLKANVEGSHVNLADNATNAQNAGNAGTVNGVSVVPFNYRRLANGPTATVFNAGGLSMTASCNGTGQLAVEVKTTATDAHIQSFTVDASSTGTDNENQDDDFDSNETYDLLPTDGADQLGQLEYSAPDGTAISVNFTADDPSPPPPVDCVFSGHAFVSTVNS
jgi:hypothetical protein